MVQQFLIQYWALIVCFIAGVVYVVTHRQISLQYAKKKAMDFMFVAEKKAEELLLSEGKDKMKWVVEVGYNYIPAGIRLFVSKPMFEMIVQEVFDGLVVLAEKHKIDAPPSPTQPIVDPAVNESQTSAQL